MKARVEDCPVCREVHEVVTFGAYNSYTGWDGREHGLCTTTGDCLVWEDQEGGAVRCLVCPTRAQMAEDERKTREAMEADD